MQETETAKNILSKIIWIFVGMRSGGLLSFVVDWIGVAKKSRGSHRWVGDAVGDSVDSVIFKSENLCVQNKLSCSTFLFSILISGYN